MAVERCAACPRLVEWRERVAVEKRAAYRDETYWGRAVAPFGDPAARVLVVGLAPGAHGANRTGRMFTGDRSGDVLYACLHEAGFAAVPWSRTREDGQALVDLRVTAAVRCAPPDNKPTLDERERCAPWLVRELELSKAHVRVIVVLGGFALDALLRAASELGLVVKPKPRFGHGARFVLGPWTVLCAFHPSQQNTFTGRLTPTMLTAVFEHAKALATGASSSGDDARSVGATGQVGEGPTRAGSRPVANEAARSSKPTSRTRHDPAAPDRDGDGSARTRARRPRDRP